MILVAVKGLLAHKLRVLMTALSIALGVAFVSGTFTLTDALNNSFSSAVTSQYAGADVVVRARAAFVDSESTGQRQPLPADVLGSVRVVPGVVRAEGSVHGHATIVGTDGKALGRGALSTDGMSAPAGAGSDVSYRSGRAPAGPDEVAVDAASAKTGSVAVGDRVRILFRGPPREFTVVGVAEFGGQASLGSTTTALFDLPTAQSVLDRPGQYDEIRVVAADGVAAERLSAEIGRTLQPGTEAVTAATVTKERTDLLEQNISFISVFLLVFAAIAVFVGSFIIWNTFTILVAQRTRELALLRAIGATRRQVLRSVLAESLVVGLVASGLGLGLGVLIARLLVVLLRAVGGLQIPAPGADLAPRTIIVSLLVGTVVTLVASIAPARKATRVAPIEALRDSAPGSYRFSGRRAAIGVAVTALGLAALAAGLFAGSGVAWVGLGVLLTFVGISVLLPLLARTLARVLGAPLPRLAGMTGALARENAMRNPKRTASTAAALMIGLALVASVSVLAASLKASLGSDVGRSLRSDLVVQQVGGQGAGLSPDLARAVRDVPGVAAVSELAFGQAKVDGSIGAIAAVDPNTITSTLDVGVRSGDVGRLGGDGVFVLDDVATAKGWQLGAPVQVEWPQTGPMTLRLAGTFTENEALSADYVVTLPTFDRGTPGRLDSLVLLRTAAGTDLGAVQASAIDRLRPYADAEVLTPDEFAESLSGQVDQFLLLITALLLLAVFIALMGIVNTLALSVFERTREIGLLRAVGMTRRQVRKMVRWESVIIAGIGAVTGSVIGIGFGVALVQALDGEGVSELAVPGVRLGIYVLLAGLAGMLAALGPARRAARVDVLRAVVHD